MKLDTWVNLTEIASGIGVIVSLFFLATRIRESTELQRTESRIRSAEWDSRILIESAVLGETLAKIKSVDGVEPPLQAYMDRYGLTYRQAAAWGRYQYLNWESLAATFNQHGPSEQLASTIRSLASWPDQQMFLATHNYPDTEHTLDPEFWAYVERVTGQVHDHSKTGTPK